LLIVSGSGGGVVTLFFVCAQSLVDISLCILGSTWAWLGLGCLLAACMRPSWVGLVGCLLGLGLCPGAGALSLPGL
jgi:hypothetical protein